MQDVYRTSTGGVLLDEGQTRDGRALAYGQFLKEDPSDLGGYNFF